MRLIVDLRFDASDGEDADGDQRIGFHRLAAAARQGGLRDLLRSRKVDEVVVIEDELPPSAVQAFGGLAASLVPVSRFRLQGNPRPLGRPRYLARALARAAAAVPRELWGTARAGAALRRGAARSYRIPVGSAEPESLIYLRIEPAGRWMGEYVGGAATHTTGVINGFSENGLEVTVFAPERPPEVDSARFVGVPVERAFHLVRALSYSDYSRAVARAAESSRADFVYQRYALGSLAGLEIAEGLGVPLVQEFNGSEIWVERHWGSGRLRMEKRLEAAERRNVTDASLVVVVSEALRDLAIDLGADPDRVLVNPNGVDVGALARFREGTTSEWRERNGIPEAPTVGFIGTFGQWHGVQKLPEIAVALSERQPDARWIVIGDGGLRGQVAEEIERRGLGGVMALTGVIEHRRALSLLAACDVCVSPHVPNPDGSPFFGSPTKLFEYMGLAKPIVASDLAQIGQVLDDGRTGLLAPPGDAPAAAELVARLLDDATLRRKLGAAALEEAERNYTWAAHTRRILRALADGRQ